MHLNDWPTITGTCAILLAAGASRRMEMPKPLLMRDGHPLAAHLANVLLEGGVEQVIIVTSTALLESLQKAIVNPAISLIPNPDSSAGMLSTVQTGVRHRALKESGVILVCPCDLPLLTPCSVYAILHCWTEEYYQDPSAIIVPTFQGKRGHPTLFGGGVQADILQMDSRLVGLNELLKRRQEHVYEVAVGDKGVVLDADTPEEWANLMGLPPTIWRGVLPSYEEQVQ